MMAGLPKHPPPLKYDPLQKSKPPLGSSHRVTPKKRPPPEGVKRGQPLTLTPTMVWRQKHAYLMHDLPFEHQCPLTLLPCPCPTTVCGHKNTMSVLVCMPGHTSQQPVWRDRQPAGAAGSFPFPSPRTFAAWACGPAAPPVLQAPMVIYIDGHVCAILAVEPEPGVLADLLPPGGPGGYQDPFLGPYRVSGPISGSPEVAKTHFWVPRGYLHPFMGPWRLPGPISGSLEGIWAHFWVPRGYLDPFLGS